MTFFVYFDSFSITAVFISVRLHSARTNLCDRQFYSDAHDCIRAYYISMGIKLYAIIYVNSHSFCVVFVLFLRSFCTF